MNPEQQISVLKQQVKYLQDRLNKLDRRDQYRFTLPLTGGPDGIRVDGATGIRLASAPSQKIGFFGTTPAIKQTTYTSPTGGATVDSQARTAIADIHGALVAYGLM